MAKENVMEKIPDLDANGTVKDPTLEINNDSVEPVTWILPAQREFKIPLDATLAQLIDILNTLKLVVAEDSEELRMINSWGWSSKPAS